MPSRQPHPFLSKILVASLVTGLSCASEPDESEAVVSPSLPSVCALLVERAESWQDASTERPSVETCGAALQARTTTLEDCPDSLLDESLQAWETCLNQDSQADMMRCSIEKLGPRWSEFESCREPDAPHLGPSDQVLLGVTELQHPVTIYAFFPEADVVRDQVERYLAQLEGGLLAVEFIDQALEPTLSEELKVRDNGWVAFVWGEGEDPQIERLKLGLAKTHQDLDWSTRNKIKDFDSEVLQRLRKISSTKQTIYLLNEHGEMHWSSENSELERISTFKKMVGQYNYRVETLGMEGLSDGVPDDAAMVMVLGAYLPFNAQEIDALNAYREQGGSLLIALRPARAQTADLSGLLEPLGLAFDGNRVLAHSNAYIAATQSPLDPYFIYTQSFTTHLSVKLLSQQKATSGALIMPLSGVLSRIESSEASPQEAIKSVPETFGESSEVPSFDPGLESRKIYTLAFAVSGPASSGERVEGSNEPREWRVFVTAGASWISDSFTGSGANALLVVDLLGWLGREGSTVSRTWVASDLLPLSQY